MRALGSTRLTGTEEFASKHTGVASLWQAWFPTTWASPPVACAALWHSSQWAKRVPGSSRDTSHSLLMTRSGNRLLGWVQEVGAPWEGLRGCPPQAPAQEFLLHTDKLCSHFNRYWVFYYLQSYAFPDGIVIAVASWIHINYYPCHLHEYIMYQILPKLLTKLDLYSHRFHIYGVYQQLWIENIWKTERYLSWTHTKFFLLFFPKKMHIATVYIAIIL